jgi:predicted HTH transcriptional regulator
VPTPREIFDDPEKYLVLLTGKHDSAVERQHLDRKEAPRVDGSGSVPKKVLDDFADQVIEVVSAFANANRIGGILVIGISKTGDVVGVDHLTESQRNRLTEFKGLRNESCQVKSHPLPSNSGPKQVLLVFVPQAASGFCETADNSRKAWIRQDLQNIRLTPDRRDSLARDKRIIDFENSRCAAFDEGDIDPDLLKQFKDSYLDDPASFNYSPAEFLRRVGAVERDHQHNLWLTNAGLLFFGRNPQGRFPRAYIRLMKFDCRSDDQQGPGLPSFEKDFDGPLTAQIRNLRVFLKGSAFLKTYQFRGKSGGFREEPELPYIAIDEAIVNAVGHRDYGTNTSIEMRLYRDALTVRNSGRVMQMGHDVPDTFSLDRTPLDHAARNSRILEWMRKMRDTNGKAFVQLLSEGTKTMTKEMLALGLPAPEFRLTPFESTLVLYSRAEEREAQYRQEAIATTEFANLYSLRTEPVPEPSESVEESREFSRRINLSLMNRLRSAGWFIDGFKFGRISMHQRNAEIRVPSDARKFVRIYPAYVLQLKTFYGNLYLCVDYDVQVKNPLRVRDLAQYLDLRELFNRRAVVNFQERWEDGRVLECDVERCRVLLFDSKQEITVLSDLVIPSLPTWRISQLLEAQRINCDLHRLVKETSLSLRKEAARIRAEKTNATVEQLATSVFPLHLDNRTVHLGTSPVLLPRQSERADALVLQTLGEPLVRFDHDKESRDIREGITKFGVYEANSRTIELVPVCTVAVRDQMASLIDRLRSGSFKFKGAERTFKTRLTYNTVVTATDPESIVAEVERLLAQRPEWRGDASLSRLFLVFAPTLNFASDDENAPYYRAKRILLEAGIPCQMVNQPTLSNPDWKDLNLALNIVAKCGVTPWVLPDAIPDADFFIGLSYTQDGFRGQEKYLGYANVFNQFGKWEFYSGSGNTFSYAERTRHFGELVSATLERLSKAHSLHPSPSIAFHYSAKFSHDDRAAILAGARAVRPDGKYTFVWINTHHIMRFYDQKPETDGSLGRGGFVVTGPEQLYISTTGFNPYRKTLGTPLVLEANVHIEGPVGTVSPAVDHKAVANQILCLTKLNWASTDSLCGEPITTKYAGDIAYLTAAFLRQKSLFKLHPILESTPWFI